MWLIIILIVIVLALTGLLIYCYSKKKHKKEPFNNIFKRVEPSPLKKYLRQVYPLASNLNNLTIEFIYSCAPRSYFGSKFIDPEKTKDYKPVSKGEWWRPIWFPKDAFALNLYSPNSWWDYQYINAYKDGSFIEAMHVRDDNPYYPVYGLWTYLAKGSGVFYAVGHTLLARNKIHALHLLGMETYEIVDYAKDKHYYYNPDKPMEPYYGGFHSFDYIINVGRDYDLDRFNNTADFDQIIVRMARAQGYDSVQFQVQANGMGGWAHEIVFVSVNPVLKKDEVKWAGWKDMDHQMTIRDPSGKKRPERCHPVINKERDVIGCKMQTLPNSCFISKNEGNIYDKGGDEMCCCFPEFSHT
jgi:hypothetical protein